MYVTSRRAAAVAAGLGLVAAALLTMKTRGHHSRLSEWFPESFAMDSGVAPGVDERRDRSMTGLMGGAARKTMLASPPAFSASAPVALESALRTGGGDLPLSNVAIGAAGDASRMIVRSGGASIEVTSIDSAIPRIRALASAIGGFVANSSVQAGRDQVRSAVLEVKAPAEGFEHLVTALSPLGKVEYVNVSAQDVGEEYVDVEARMANDHKLEERLIELLASRTGKLKDVLDVERELARVREEIERYEGRLRFLRAHAELSTLSITVHEPVPIIDHVAPNPIAAATRQAWHNFIGLVAFVIASMGVLLPVAAVAGGLWWMVKPAKPGASTQAV
jgi:hypothetical protein